MFETLSERLQWSLKNNGQKEFHICEDHYKASKAVRYYAAELADEYTVCIWRIKLKPGLMFDNTSNPES